MRVAIPLLALGLLLAAPPAAARGAGPAADLLGLEQPLLEVTEELEAVLVACLAGTLQGTVRIHVDIDADPPVEVSAPELAPPDPSCANVGPL